MQQLDQEKKLIDFNPVYCSSRMLFYFIYSIVILRYYCVTVTDALNWITVFWKEIYSLRDRESLLQSQLTIFGINYPASQELEQLDKVNVVRIYHLCALPRAYSTFRCFSTCEGCSSDRIGVAIDGRMERHLESLQNRKFLDDRIGRDGHNR